MPDYDYTFDIDNPDGFLEEISVPVTQVPGSAFVPPLEEPNESAFRFLLTFMDTKRQKPVIMESEDNSIIVLNLHKNGLAPKS